MKIFILIVTYNGMKWLEKCLASIPKEYEIIVVDNNSTDGTVDFIKHNYSQIHLFEEKENLGFGQANNKAIGLALSQEADYVYLLNQDAYLEPSTISSLLAVQSNNQAYGILSPMHYKASFTGLDENFLMYMERYKIHKNYIFDANEHQLKDVYEIPFVNAAGWLISRKTLETVGGFDPIFFHYGEDRNYCQRILYHGYKIGIVPEAKMVHDREDRKKSKVQKFSALYYDEYAKYAKIDWADINLKNFETKIHHKIAYIDSEMRKAYLKLNFKQAKDLKIKSNILKDLNPLLKDSRMQNEKKYPSYL